MSEVKERAKESSLSIGHLNNGEEDEMEVKGYERSGPKTLLTWTLILLSGGILRLLFHWWPHLMLKATHRLSALRTCNKVLITETYGRNEYQRYYVKRVKKLDFQGSLGQSDDQVPLGGMQMRYFYCKKLRYIWNDLSEGGVFVKLQGLDHSSTTTKMFAYQGLSAKEQGQRRELYGSNEIKVKITPILKLLLLEILNPFYVFQVASVLLWYIDLYYYYASAIVIMSVGGLTSTIYQTRQNEKRLRSTIQSTDIIEVCRGGGVFETIPMEELVPGDVIVIPSNGCLVSCDAVLLTGNCIVNESMLTGESVPVTKTPLENTSNVPFDPKEHARHTLFCGTKIVQTRYYGNEKVLALVIRTGFLTAKGNLVRSIMYPPPVDYKFEKDSYKFVGFLALLAALGFFASITWKIKYELPLNTIIIQSLDLITIVIPPALPAAMTAGRIYALKRLQQNRIFCISPRTITVAGSIDCVCFDKTGTLTEEGLDLWGVVPTAFLPSDDDGLKSSRLTDPIRDYDKLEDNHLKGGMASCHSLTLIDQEIVGDPLDLKMFEWTKWTLEEPELPDTEKFDTIVPSVVKSTDFGKDNIEIGIIRQFPFSSNLQRMSVITRKLGDEDFHLYAKGSPEIISSLSVSESIPQNFAQVLGFYTEQGYRVIALGRRRLALSYTKIQRELREDLEKDLTFCGLIVLENRLKPETTREISILRNAGVRTIMVTGDNIQTASSVAIDCGMIGPTDDVVAVDVQGDQEPDSGPILTFTQLNKVSTHGQRSQGSISLKDDLGAVSVRIPHDPRSHMAVTGKAFSVIRAGHPELLERLLVRGTVFARMSPDQKQQLVEYLQTLGYFVGMCGDGANDCGALKAAHVGISLSDTEASVAAPFTYKDNNISCVSLLLREGRTALVTSFGIFKYMAIYSFTQFISVLILYTVTANISDFQFLYTDLFIISLFALFFGNTEPFPGELHKRPPPLSLVSLAPVASILLHMTLTFLFQVGAFLFVKGQSWFEPFIPDLDDKMAVESYENYAVFTISIFQYITMAVVFSQGRPYRKSIFSNYRLISSIIIMTFFTIYLVIKPCSFLDDLFLMMIPPSWTFQVGLLGAAGVNFIIAYAIEEGVVNGWLGKYRGDWSSWSCFCSSKNKERKGELEYERIERKLKGEGDKGINKGFFSDDLDAGHYREKGPF